MKTLEEAKQDSEYSKIPPLVLKGLIKYRDKGVIPGGFLSAVLANDLFEAVGRADMWSMKALKEIVMFVYNEMPSTCWGSEKAMELWHEYRKEENNE